MPTVTQESAECILGKYLEVVNEIPEITDIVYAMGNAIAEKMGIKRKKEPRKSRPGNGNRRERKIKANMKQLRQKVARVCNVLHRRKLKRKATRKEKMILKELKTQVEGLNPTTKTLIRYKELWASYDTRKLS